jgi:hypothetical protein
MPPAWQRARRRPCSKTLAVLGKEFSLGLLTGVVEQSEAKLHRLLAHLQAAEALETLFADRLEVRYNELAHHYSRSRNTAKAVDYLQRAGQQAVQRPAYANAVQQ